jgi:hypothetical protein
MLKSDLKKFVCIHGHFYQPPRENAWLGEIEYQESAAPFHNWNERILSAMLQILQRGYSTISKK